MVRLPQTIVSLTKLHRNHRLASHSASLLMECTPDSSVLLQMLAASAARGRHAALRRERGVVRGRPARTQVLLGEPAVSQRLVRSAAHRRGQRHRTSQRTVLPTRQHCEDKNTRDDFQRTSCTSGSLCFLIFKMTSYESY